MTRRVDELRSGDLFRCIQGKLWRYLRRDHARSGAHWAACVMPLGDDSGSRITVGEDCFAGAALVEVVAGTTSWSPSDAKLPHE